MAIPIKQTPVIRGKDAERFKARMKQNEGKKLSADEQARITRNFEKINALFVKK